MSRLSPSRFRDLYGASPLHLLAAIASFAIAGYAIFRVFQTPTALGFLVWFGAAIVAHDLVAFPLYSLLNLVATSSLGGTGGSDSELRVPALNHLRVPALLSGLALLLFFPLVLGLSADNYVEDTGVEIGVFLSRWLALVAVLFAGSGLIYAVRLGRAERLAAKDPTS